MNTNYIGPNWPESHIWVPTFDAFMEEKISEH